MDNSTENKPLITPELIDSIFTDEVLSILPKDENINRAVALFNATKTEHWKVRHKQGAEKRAQSKEWRDNQRKAMEDLKTTAEWKQKHAACVKSRLENPEWKQRHAEGTKKRMNDPEWRRKQQERAFETEAKCMVTPYGVFRSNKQAAEAAGITPSSLIGRMKRNPTEYYYISKEEYDLIVTQNKT